MRKFRQGQTVYCIVTQWQNCDFRLIVERAMVTNDPAPLPQCNPIYDGKISRHFLNKLDAMWSMHVTRSRRVAERRCRILNQCRGYNA